MQVEKMQQRDIPWVIEELENFARWNAGKYNLFPHPGQASLGIQNFIENHLALVVREARGLIMGWVMPHPFNPQINLLAEAFWWVSPPHRRSRAGLLLLDAFVEFGVKNAHMITFALEAESPVNERILTKRGFRLKERAYVLEV